MPHCQLLGNISTDTLKTSRASSQALHARIRLIVLSIANVAAPRAWWWSWCRGGGGGDGVVVPCQVVASVALLGMERKESLGKLFAYLKLELVDHWKDAALLGVPAGQSVSHR